MHVIYECNEQKCSRMIEEHKSVHQRIRAGSVASDQLQCV